jgi:hypothetical protein
MLSTWRPNQDLILLEVWYWIWFVQQEEKKTAAISRGFF